MMITAGGPFVSRYDAKGPETMICRVPGSHQFPGSAKV